MLTNLVAIYWLRIYRHPLLLRLSHHPEQLPDLEPESLAEARHLLRRTRRLDTTLARTGIGGRTLDLAFFLGEQNGRFAFRVPLFRDMIRRLEPERSLPRLVRKVQQG